MFYVTIEGYLFVSEVQLSFVSNLISQIERAVRIFNAGRVKPGILYNYVFGHTDKRSPFILE